MSQEQPQLVMQLVEHSLRKVGVQDRQAIHLAYTLAVRLLGSMMPSSVLDEQALVHALRKEVEQRGGSRDAGQRLLEAHSRLQSQSGMDARTRTALLALLSRLATEQRSSSGSQALGVLGHSMTSTAQLGGFAASLPIIHASIQQALATQAVQQQAVQQPQPGPPQQAYTVTFPPSLESSFSEQQQPARARQSRHAGNHHSGLSNGGTMEGAADGVAESSESGSHFSVTEPLLVRDVLYACQGIDGKFIVFKDDAPTTLATPPQAASSTTLPASRQASAASAASKGGGKGTAGAGGAGSDTQMCDQGLQSAGGGYVVVPEAQVPPYPDRMLVSRLMELGWLFRRVQKLVSPLAASAGGSGPASRQGAIRQALHGALQSELADYYRLLAVLEHHAAQPMPLPGEGDAGGGGTYLTLRRLVVWLGEAQRRMQHLALLADATEGQSGGALAGTVHALTQHGDPFIASFTTKVLHAVCVPLFNMIRRWVFEGVLEDPHAEFFVQAAPWLAAYRGKLAGELAALSLGPTAPLSNGSTSSSQQQQGQVQGGVVPQQEQRELWRHGYWLDRAQLPAFISEPLASKVLRAGKSINFLQGVCGDVHWAQEAGAHAAAAALSQQAINPGALEALERAVDMAAALVDARVMEVLHSRYQLATHCDALRRYLLLGQGDFVQALMELVSAELEREAGHVSEVQLGHALRTAITASAAKYDDEEVVERLRARKARSAAGKEVGWDVFTLQYDVPAPLATIFTPTAMSQYLRVFQLLWRLKRVDASLAGCWRLLSCSVQRALSRLDKTSRGGADQVVRRLLRLRATMVHFVTNLQYYLNLEAMDPAWQEFTAQANTAADLDSLIAAHEHYLNTLMVKCLLDDSSQRLRDTLNKMTGNMLGLHGVAKRLSEAVDGARQLQARRGEQVARRTAAGEWGSTTGPVQGVNPQEMASVAETLAELERAHDTLLQTFTQQLPAQAHDEVRFLLCRLDFNEFASKTWRASEDGRQQLLQAQQ